MLVVAAPSGAGKSRFLLEMGSFELPQKVMTNLPSGAQKWMRLRVAGHQVWSSLILEANKRKALPGVVVDYDMTRGIAVSGGYHHDPALNLLRLAQRITVVNLQPPLELIVSQLRSREIEAPMRRRVRLGKLMRIAAEFSRHTLIVVASALPRSVIIRFGLLRPFAYAWNTLNAPRVSVNVERKKKLSATLNQYEQEGWLDQIYDRWQAYLESLTREGVAIEQIFLEPDPDTQTDGIYHWRVASSGPQPRAGVSA